MHWLLTLSRADHRPLFSSDLDHALFLDRLSRLNRRWQVQLRAFSLAGSRARLLLHGAEDSVGHVGRLQQSGWGVWRHHRGDFVCWEPSVREGVGGDRSGGCLADQLHREGGVVWPWSSLREAVGLRSSHWVDATWLQSQGAPLEHLHRAAPDWVLPGRVPPGWRASDPLAWPRVEGAVLHATGQDPGRRSQRVLRTRLAWSAGWSIQAISQQLEVQPRAVARCLRRGPDPVLGQARALLYDARLSKAPLVEAEEWATPATLEVLCLAIPNSWSVLAG